MLQVHSGDVLFCLAIVAIVIVALMPHTLYALLGASRGVPQLGMKGVMETMGTMRCSGGLDPNHAACTAAHIGEIHPLR